MSGLAMGYGNPDRRDIEAMMRRIKHRGPQNTGYFETKRAILAQNYLRADCAGEPRGHPIPVVSSQDENLRICYDGQMGNWHDLAPLIGVRDGPFREERLLLQLYRQCGTEMLEHLNDAIFAFVIYDNGDLFAARDLLGIKTLYYGRENETLYLASELKSIIRVTADVHEFPPGHYMDRYGRFFRFAELPERAPQVTHTGVDRIKDDIRAIIEKSLLRRVDFSMPVGSLLSGGIDSSVVAYLANQAYKEAHGESARLRTFALGIGESPDIKNARVMAATLNTDHHELIVDLKGALSVLPQVIYYLESFDPSLVRSSVSNYLVSKYAREHGVQILLSGEGGDEVFCGYTYLKNYPLDELFERQMECIGFLHNNASLRLDRMNQCNGIRVVAPIISGELLNYAMAIPPDYKQRPADGQRIEKWIFRKAFESLLPDEIIWRGKQEFSQGAGAATLLPAHFEDVVTDDELAEAQATYPMVRSKEESYYFRIFAEHFRSEEAVKTVGQWLCL